MIYCYTERKLAFSKEINMDDVYNISYFYIFKRQKRSMNELLHTNIEHFSRIAFF